MISICTWGWQRWAGDSLIRGMMQSATTGLEERSSSEPVSAHLETMRPGRRCLPLWCLGLGLGVYRTMTRVGLGHAGRAKGTFQLWGGFPHSRATSF